MNKAVLKSIVLVMTSSLIFTACSKNTNAAKSNGGSKKSVVNSTDVRLNPEETIKAYYNDETSKDAKFLSSFFLNSTEAPTAAVKQQLSDFNVKKIELVKTYNKKEQGNYITMLCEYNTYFTGIESPRPDVELVTLVKKSGKWYFLNDYNNVSEEDMNWITTTSSEEKSQLSSNKEIEKVLQQKEAFDSTNSSFMNNGRKSMEN